MPVNCKPEADRTREPEFTTGDSSARTGDTICEPQLQPRRADEAVVSRSSLMGLSRFLGVILILTVLGAPVHALRAVLPPGQSVTLVWDPSPDSNVVGYNMYYGVASRTYTNMVDLGNVTSTTISGLVEGTTYFFAATAYNILGMESELSDEVSYNVPGTIPGALAILQIRVTSTRQVVLTVTGEVGRTYDIQASPDCITWSVINTVLMPVGGSLDLTDTNAANSPNRFYRTQ